MPSTYLSRKENIVQSLNQRRQQEQSLFSVSPYYWRLSDLAFLYPSVFDVEQPIAYGTKYNMSALIKETVPEFKQINEEPIHVLDVKDSYNILIPATNDIQHVKNGKNQYLTTVACEYVFSKVPGYEFEQAYFMCPDQNLETLDKISESLRFEYVRSQVAESSKTLAAIINRAKGHDNNSFKAIWARIWRGFYCVDSVSDLKKNYNLKDSPIDYADLDGLNAINKLLQKLISSFSGRPNLHIEEMYDYVSTIAQYTRSEFITQHNGIRPEEKLSAIRFYRNVENVQTVRKNFWRKNYLNSLNQK